MAFTTDGQPGLGTQLHVRVPPLFFSLAMVGSAVGWRTEEMDLNASRGAGGRPPTSLACARRRVSMHLFDIVLGGYIGNGYVTILSKHLFTAGDALMRDSRASRSFWQASRTIKYGWVPATLVLPAWTPTSKTVSRAIHTLVDSTYPMRSAREVHLMSLERRDAPFQG